MILLNLRLPKALTMALILRVAVVLGAEGVEILTSLMELVM
jgi:hypothetical protein